MQLTSDCGDVTRNSHSFRQEYLLALLRNVRIIWQRSNEV